MLSIRYKGPIRNSPPIPDSQVSNVYRGLFKDRTIKFQCQIFLFAVEISPCLAAPSPLKTHARSAESSMHMYGVIERNNCRLNELSADRNKIFYRNKWQSPICDGNAED